MLCVQAGSSGSRGRLVCRLYAYARHQPMRLLGAKRGHSHPRVVTCTVSSRRHPDFGSAKSDAGIDSSLPLHLAEASMTRLVMLSSVLPLLGRAVRILSTYKTHLPRPSASCSSPLSSFNISRLLQSIIWRATRRRLVFFAIYFTQHLQLRHLGHIVLK